MGPRLHQIDNADRVPQAAQHADSAPWQRERRWMPDWRSLAVLCAFVLLLLLIGYWLFGRDVRDWVQFGGGDAYVTFALWIAFGYVALRALTSAVLKAILVEQRGYKVLVWNADTPRVVEQLIAVDTAYAKRLFPVAAQVTNTTIPPMLPEAADIIDIVPEEDVIGLVPDSEWRQWIVEMPHTMIAGGTGTGKTTLARIELHERLQQGYAGIVLDPKGKDWYSLPVFGSGRKFEEILAMLDQLHREMAERFTAYADGERTFQPIKALIDEVPDIMDSCLDMRRRLVDGRWSRFSRQLGSLAREIGISVTLMTQSPLVEDIGMNSAMRKNFNRIALGDEAQRLIREESDRERKAMLQDALRGLQFPAAMIRRGQVHLLDTSNVVWLSQRHIVSPLGWTPCTPSPLPMADGAIVYPAGIASTNAKIAWLLKQQYSYRQIARELSVSFETISQVKKATGI